MTSERLPPLPLLLARYALLSAADRILLHDVLDSAAALCALSRTRLEALCGRRFRSTLWEPELWLQQAQADHVLLKKLGISSVHYFDPRYPALLRETSRPPYLLYVRGWLPALQLPSLAVVGTRFPTGRGLQAAATLAAEAATCAVAVISGLARGIDTAAHCGALAAGGVTVAVLGCGIDMVYPRGNKSLAARLVGGGGCLVSEYAPGVNPARWTFPERNRIIAGLARSTLVVEAPEGSGALITSSFALEEGRDVYVAGAVRGSIRSRGSDALESDGAKVIESFQDIADDWRFSPLFVSEGVMSYASSPAFNVSAHAGTQSISGRSYAHGN